MKNLLNNQWQSLNVDRVYKIIGAGGILMILICLVSFLYCAAMANNAKHIANVMRIRTEIAKREKDIRCYEEIHNATHLYFSIYQTIDGTRIDVGNDDKDACRTLEARRRAAVS